MKQFEITRREIVFWSIAIILIATLTAIIIVAPLNGKNSQDNHNRVQVTLPPYYYETTNEITPEPQPQPAPPPPPYS